MIEIEVGKELRNRFRKLARFTRIHHDNVENWTGPDYQVRSRTGDWWVSIKHINHTNIRSSGFITIPWRSGQKAWLETHYRYGGNAALVVNYRNKYFFVMDMVNIFDNYNSFRHLKDMSDYDGLLDNAPDNMWD